MSEDACSCEDPELVTVYDKNLEPAYVSGNKYSRYCLNCGRRYFCKASYWERADEKWVIPKGAEEPVPAEDYEGGNFFECPECDHPDFGKPDECANCETNFYWGGVSD